MRTHLKTYAMLFFFLCLGVQNVFAQATIKGKVIDAVHKSPIPDVSVRVKGQSTTTVTDSQGEFQISTSSDAAVLEFRHIGYQFREVAARGVTRESLIMLTSSSRVIDEVQVAVRKRLDNEASLLEERRKSATVQDGISAQLIERTASITTTQALQRVVGVTVTDEKYVAVRGLGDRSVIAQLNGARLASSNPDRSAISLDLVPAALLDNITVLKTYTPDKPADAASGIIDLKTKSIPDKKILQIEIMGGTNSNIGFGGQFNSFENSNMGTFGTKVNDKQLSPEFLQLSQQYPNGVGSIQEYIANAKYSEQATAEVKRINGLMQSFDPVLITRYRNATPDQRYSLTFGNNYDVFGKHKIGLILGGNYFRRTTDINNGSLNQFSVYQGVVTGGQINSPRYIPNYITPNNLYLGRYQTYNENTGNETLNYGVLGGLAYRFSPRHEISVQYMGSWGSENNATSMLGAYDYSGLDGPVNSYVYALKQTFRTLNTVQIHGDHKLSEGIYAARLAYSGSTSKSVQRDPDYRYTSLVEYIPADGGILYEQPQMDDNFDGYLDSTSRFAYTDRVYTLMSGYVNGYGPKGTLQVDPNGRRWRELNEENYNYKVDLSLPFEWLDQKQEVKFGGNYLFRRRDFSENHLFLPGSNYTDMGNYWVQKVRGDLDKLVSNEIIGVRQGTASDGEGAGARGGFLYNIQKSANNYKSYFETMALYGMADLRLDERWRIVGGIRLETTNIGSRVDTVGIYVDPTIVASNSTSLEDKETNSRYKTGYKPYYAMNVIYSLRPDMNFRLAFNTTLARPELREITNVFEYDAFQMGLVVGNPNLKNQNTENLDFRWEWFPASGEVIAVSAFGKRIHDQLVRTFSLKTSGAAAIYPEFPTIRFENEQNVGTVWGFELEMVKNLGNMWEYAKGFSVGSNLLLAQSNIKKSDSRYNASKTLDRHTPRNSPLFEQAPYSINAWLNYENNKWGSDFTTTFNMVGERLVQINMLGEPDLYTRPVAMLDFVWSQKVYKKLFFKGYAKNLLNPEIKTVYANPGTGGKWYGNEYIQRSYRRGIDVMMGVSYNFF
ncbi:TonB-dependent receptor domain-containing protein [Sphingobacterium sp. LRF_L2]|uniref:TonB-dependent receptor domain-containing protein n=1 Tax=Sphingobacterium sp. LRF_L2 TaxID=3369421 RepID=UPI003F5F61CE